MELSDFEQPELLTTETAAEPSYTLTRGTQEERVERKLRRSQINAERLSLMFKLEKSSVHLVDEFNGHTEWPNRDGRFDLRSFSDGSFIIVDGSLRPRNQLPSTSTLYSTSSQSRPYSQMFSSVIPTANLPHKAKKARLQSYSLKVTYAALEGGKIKNPTRQMYILINDETANVEYIRKQCEEELKKNGILLATSNGLLIEDSAGTRGLAFWKSTARKIFAVKGKIKKEPEDVFLIEDNEKVINDHQDGITYATILSALETQTADIKSFMNMKLEVVKDSSFVYKVKELLKCVVCQETSKPEIQFGGCCGSILGCGSCLEQWYQDNENCPKCRSVFGKSVLYTVRGFDDLVAKLKDD